MSYPYDNPSLSMNTIWSSGSYKPADATRTIRDNYTPVNKNSMTNSVGQEIALVQNYINSKYVGRPELPIVSGYISNLSGISISTATGCFQTLMAEATALKVSGHLVINSGIPYDSSYGLTVGCDARSSNGDAFFRTHGGGGVAIYGDNGNIDRVVSFGNHFYVTCGPSNVILDNDNQTIELTAKTKANSFQTATMNFLPLADGELYSTVGMFNSGNIEGGLQVSGVVVIGSGAQYAGASNGGGNHYGLTVGDIYGSGNAFFRTYQGGGIAIFGAQNGGVNAYDFIKSYAPESFGIYHNGGGSISLDKVTSTVFITPSAVSSNGNVQLYGNKFGCNSVAASGQAVVVANPTDPTTTMAATVSILNLLKNVGLMSKT